MTGVSILSYINGFNFQQLYDNTLYTDTVYVNIDKEGQEKYPQVTDKEHGATGTLQIHQNY